MHRLGGCRGDGVEARERELEGGGRRVEIAGLVEVSEGGGETCEEERGTPREAEDAGGEQGQEMDQDGQPDREFDRVLGVAAQQLQRTAPTHP